MKTIRGQFPALNNGIYANTAASGLLYRDLSEWRIQHDLDFLVGGGAAKMTAFEKVIPETRDAVASFFNGDAENVALVPNFTIGLNMLLEGLLKTKSILLLEEEYPSVNWPVEERGFPAHYIKIDADLEDRIYEAVKTKKVDVFVFSIVQYISGIKIDLDFINQLKRDFPDLILIADGTQYCGTERFDFYRSGIDILGVSAYKWLLGGYGNGFLMVSDAVKEQFSLKSIGNASSMWGGYQKADIPFCRYLEPGHLDTLNFGSLKYSLEFLTGIRMDQVEKTNQILRQTARSLFSELGLLDEMVLERNDHSTIFALKGDDKVFEKLMNENVICSQRGGKIRLSFHFYNTLDEINKINLILKNLL